MVTGNRCMVMWLWVYVWRMLGAIAWHRHKALCLADLQARLDDCIYCPDGSRYRGQHLL